MKSPKLADATLHNVEETSIYKVGEGSFEVEIYLDTSTFNYEPLDFVGGIVKTKLSALKVLATMFEVDLAALKEATSEVVADGVAAAWEVNWTSIRKGCSK